MNGIAERPPEVLPSHPFNLLGTLSLHPTKDLRGLLDYSRTQIYERSKELCVREIEP